MRARIGFLLLWGLVEAISHVTGIEEPIISERRRRRTTEPNLTPDTRQGVDHPCYRTCVRGETKTCVYSMTATKFSSMSVFCGDCPYNVTECFKPSCITAGGLTKIVSVVNEMLPGPSIFVCLNDTVIINFRNEFRSESTTIHWHGIHQIGTPWQDGVPFVSQCPILPGESFRYIWKAFPSGTHMWHGHTGFQEADGLFGQLVVRDPNDIHKSLYDRDEHSMIAWHWMNQTLDEFYIEFDFNNGPLQGYDIIINGLSAKTVFTRNGTTFTTPRATFKVKQGLRYRFRMAFNSAVYCPMKVSVDGHTLLMIASDSGEFEPVNVTSFIGNAGERYDFVLNANQPVDAYWIRVQGVGTQCNPVESPNFHVVQEAILLYEGSKQMTPKARPGFLGDGPSGPLLNPVQQSAVNYTQNQVIKISQLQSVVPVENVSGRPNMTIYLEFKVNTYLKMNLVVFYPQVNNITYKEAPSNLLTQYQENRGRLCNPMLKKMYCNSRGLCQCPYVQEIPLNALVEVVLVNTDIAPDINEDHPIHLHGYHFQVVAMGTIGPNVSTDYVRKLNEGGKIQKSVNKRSNKDTISIPNSGYAIFRFPATNPGYWMMHCHFSDHIVAGMAVIMKVGKDGSEIPLPGRDFPRCQNYPLRTRRSPFMLDLSSPK